MKDYLASEHDRNVHKHRTFERLLRLAFGPDVSVLVAHHITFTLEPGGEPNEIPSADTAMFDHEIMGRAFGKVEMFALMAYLAVAKLESRDALLEDYIGKEEDARTRKQAEELAATAADAG